METLNAICCCLTGGKQPAPDVCNYLTLHTQRKAPECKVTMQTISGEGAALSTAAILQDRSYWEAKVQQLGAPSRRVQTRPSARYLTLARRLLCAGCGGSPRQAYRDQVWDDNSRTELGSRFRHAIRAVRDQCGRYDRGKSFEILVYLHIPPAWTARTHQ